MENDYLIKNIYKVNSKNGLGVLRQIENYILNAINSLKFMNNKHLESISIRISYKPMNRSRQVYIILLDIDLKSTDIRSIMHLINKRLINRDVDLATITSLHLHLQYV